MAKIPGRLESVGIGKESSRGTAVAASYWIPWMELSLEDRAETALNEASLGRLEATDGEDVVATYGEATIKSKMKDKQIGLFLLSLFGTDTPAANGDVSGLVYDHVYTVNQTTQHQSLTISHKSSNDDVRYANMVVDSLKISAQAGNYVMYEAHLLGKSSASASNTVAHAAENDFLAQNITFKKATTQSGLDAASAVTIRDFSLEFKQNVMREHVLGATDPNDILTPSFTVEGSVTLVHNDSTFSTLQKNGTYNAMRFDIKNTGVTIGTAANPELKIDLHRVTVTGYQRVMKLNDIVEESFNIRAHYSLTDSKMVTATLTNLVASY